MQKFNALLADGVWKIKPTQNENIIALEAKITDLEAELASQTKPSQQTTQPNKKQKLFNQMAKWRKTPPTPGTSEVMTKNDRTFYWCANHGYWNASHPTEKCLMKSNPTNTKPTLSLNIANLPTTEFTDLDICLACAPNIVTSSDIGASLDKLTQGTQLKD